MAQMHDYHYQKQVDPNETETCCTRCCTCRICCAPCRCLWNILCCIPNQICYCLMCCPTNVHSKEPEYCCEWK